MTERLIDHTTSRLLEKFGAGNHRPGSGSAAALQGLLSAQLIQTVISLTNEPKRSHFYAPHLPGLLEIKSALERRIIPSLEKLFQQDSDNFDVVIQLRRQKDNETDPVMRRQWAHKAKLALIPATEIPIQIAKDCVELASFALDVFDKGFQAALGDSGVALSAALSAVFGSLSIVELNLQRFEANAWTASIRASRDVLTAEYNLLMEQARKRLASQLARTESRTRFSNEIQEIAVTAKGKMPLPESEIESIAMRLQAAMWDNKSSIWKNGDPETEFEVLNPDKALESFGLAVEYPATLGYYVDQGSPIEVAGQIDQHSMSVSISKRFPKVTQRFTAAHELGHYLFHSQPVLHRDRPIDGFRTQEPRGSEEWQADKFAAYFLMPSTLVKEIFTRHFLTEKFGIDENTAFALNEKSPRALRSRCGDLRGLSRLLSKATFYNGVNFDPMCDRFNVSVEALAIRLEELELVTFSE
jgi:formiminotetrahydrofolate cyclodeaminase